MIIIVLSRRQPHSWGCYGLCRGWMVRSLLQFYYASFPLLTST